MKFYHQLLSDFRREMRTTVLCLSLLFGISQGMPARNLKDSKTEVSIEVDPALFLAFLEATDPQLALKALPKILGGENIHLIRRHSQEVLKNHFRNSRTNRNGEHQSDEGQHEDEDKKKIFRLY